MTTASAARQAMPWGKRVSVLAAGLLVMLVSAVIALVVIATQIGFYRQNMRVQTVSMLGLPPIDLPTFTPIAVEALAWVFTAMAVILVLFNRMAGRWTNSMWLFASIAAVVNAWHNLHQGDWLSGVVTGGLSVAGPYMVHMFVAFTRTMTHGKTIEQTIADFGDRVAAIRRSVLAFGGHVLDHAVHPVIAVRTIGIWRGHRGMSYDLAWLIASVNYRTRIKQRIVQAQSRMAAAGAVHGESVAVHDAVHPVAELTVQDPVHADATAPEDTVHDSTVHAGGVAVLDHVERESITNAEELFALWEQQLAEPTVHGTVDLDGRGVHGAHARPAHARESSGPDRESGRESRPESGRARRPARRESGDARTPNGRESRRTGTRESGRARTTSGTVHAVENTGGMLKRDMVIHHYWTENPDRTDLDDVNFSAIGKELGVDRATVSRIYRECASGQHPRPAQAA